MADSHIGALFRPAATAHGTLAGRQSELFRAAARLIGSQPSTSAYFVPGRIEILGKHTDYCGGRSLLCAIDRGFAVVSVANHDKRVRVADALGNRHCEIALEPDAPAAIGHWSNYPVTVVRRLVRNFGAGLVGCDIALASDLPPAAGLSSSSALIVGIFLAIAAINRLDEHPAFAESIHTLEDLAHYCGCIENGSAFGNLAGQAGVGTSGGSQDHTAILCSRPATLSQFGFAPVVHERDIALPDGVSLVVLNSGVVAEKTGSALEQYNAVSARARRLVSMWNSAAGERRATLASIVRSAPDAAARLHAMIDSAGDDVPSLHARLDQFITESEQLIPAAGDALLAGDVAAFGAVIRRSTGAAVEGLQNQVARTLALVDLALLAGAIAASPFGAGFGGSVWAMVDSAKAERFVAECERRIATDLPGAAVVPVNATAGARTISM